MAKYTYFSTAKGGKYLIRNQFWLNRRSTCYIEQKNPLWCVLSKPVGVLDKLEWWWCDKDNQLQSHTHLLDTRDKLTNDHYYEFWFPIKDHRGREKIYFRDWVTHENFWGTFDNIISRDIICMPFTLLGYVGKLGSEKMMRNMQDMSPNMQPHPDILPQLRKRKNIVAYKENIEHLAFQVFGSWERPRSYEETARKVDNIIRFQNMIPQVLESYDIPYEMFSLDSGDYKETFDLTQELPRDSSDGDTLFTDEENKQKVKREVKKYLDSYQYGRLS